MLQPSQDKSKVLYDVVSKDYDIGSYDEFSSKLQNPEKRKAFYEGVGKEYALGSYEEFESKVAPLKKKDKSDVTATPQKLVSETSTGSLDGVGSNGFPAIDKNLGVPGLKPDLKTVDQLANSPKSKSTIQEKTTNKEDVKGFGEGLLNRLDTGIARISKSFYDAPKMILDAIYAPQNYLSEKLNIPSLKVDPETYAFENIPSKNMDEIVNSNNKKIENYKKEIGGDVVSTFDKGDYVNTFKHAALNSMESAPLIAAAMATGGESLLANSLMIGSSASTQYDQLNKEHPEMGTRTKLANAAVNGALEVAVGKFMEGVGGNVWKNVLAKKGVKETAQIATNSFKKTLEKVVGNSPMVGVAGEYAEERITDGLQQLNDIATGASTEFNWDQNKNAGLSSLGFGLPNATALYSAKAYISNKTRKRVTETSKQIVRLQNDLQNPDLSPEKKKIISENISKIYDENKKILGDELQKLDIMPEKTKKELVGIDKNIDKIKDSAIDIKYDVNISPENKALLLKNLEQDLKDNINRKNEILSKTSEVEFLPLKEQDKLKRQALKELTAELNPDGKKNIEIDNAQIVERANKIYKTEQENLIKEKDAKVEIPIAETEVKTEVQEPTIANEEKVTFTEQPVQDQVQYELNMETGEMTPVVNDELNKGNKIQWNVFGNEENGEWTVGEKVKTRGGQDAVILSKTYVESSSDGKSYTKEYADANGIKYDNERTVDHIVPISELKQNEATPPTNTPINGNVQSRTSNVGESGITEPKGSTEKSVSSSVDGGEGKGDASVGENNNSWDKEFQRAKSENDLKALDVLYDKVKVMLNGIAQKKGEETVRYFQNLKNEIKNYSVELKKTVETLQPKSKEVVGKVIEPHSEVNTDVETDVSNEKTPSRKEKRIKVAEAKIDDFANALKDLLPSVPDTEGLRKQGLSQDDIIDFIAKAAKELAKTGIEIDEAIRQVIGKLNERFEDLNVDENLVKAKLGVEKPKSKTKNPLREKSSEEIADDLGISEKEYLDLKSFVANEPSSGIFNEYLSADTIADVFGDGPTNDQQYEQMVLLNAVQHGNSVLEKARGIFGENYMSKTLEFLQNVKLGNFEKAMVYAALENEIDTLVKANPSNKVFLATQRLIYADSQANLRNSSKGLNAGRLRRIHNAIKNGYDIDKLTSGLIKPEQQEAKQILKDAIPTGDNLNKASEQEENEIDSEERIYTQNELDEAIEKARREFEEENLGFEIRESKVKIKKEDALEQIRKIKENWKKASRDGTLSASLPYAKQVIAVAPDVIQLAKLYSQIAGMKTIDIVQAIKNDVSEVFDLITEKDIKGILKKEYGAKSRKMSEATKRKIYVKLLNKAIESLDAQIQAKKRDVVTRVDKYKNDSEIKELRKKRAEKRNELAIVDPSYAESRKLATDLKLAQKSLDEYQRRIDENELTLSEKDPKIVDEKLKKLRDLRDSKRKEFLKKKKDFEDSLKDPVVPLTKEELADKKYLSDVKSKINSINKRIEELKSNKPKSNDAKSTLWSSEISKLQNELISLTSKREYQEKKIIDRLEKRLEDLKSKKAKDNLGASSVWNQQISDIQNEIKKEKENQKEPKKTKTSDVVRKALIDAGFSREITVTKNAKDENGNDIIENGKKVKIKETKEVLDWNKLTGRMNSVEALRSNVEDKLKEQGYTDSQIEEISNELETEYKRLTEYIADKALTELERRNQIPKPVNRKSDLDRLVDYHNKGLFGESAKGYERLINKIVGITKREQDVLDKIESEIEKIKNLREVKIDGSFPDAQSIESQASYIAKSIRNIIAWSNLVNSPLKLQIITVLSDVAGISRAAVLGNLYNAFQNIYSNNRAGFLARMKFKAKGYWTPELNDAFNELKNTVTSDVLLNRGLDFGDTVSPFSNHSIFIEKIKDYINKKYPEGVKRQRAIGILNTFEGRLFLNVMDSRFKSKIVNIDFVMNLVDVLTSERAGKSKMTKEEAINFVSESLTGVNLEKAKVLAKKFIDDVNAMKEGTLLKNEDNIKRLAFDIVRENLTSGNNFTMDEINDIYQASMKSGGINIGHESNNIASELLKNLNNFIEKKLEDAMKEKDYDEATKYATYALISKNIVYPYMSGGLNWAVLEAEAGTPLGLATGAYKSYKNKDIDLLTDVGRKRMKEDLINRRDAESKLFRGIWGTSIGVSAYLAYYGLQVLSAVGDDDDENRRIFNKYLRDNPEQRKIFDKFSPEVYAVSLAASDERLSKYLLNKMGYKTDQNDNVLTLVKSLQDKNSSSAGALGVLLGQVISTPGAWRILRDTKRLYKELQGEPMAQSKRRVTSFLNGYFKGGLVDYLGLRPDVNYDLEKVKKEIDNKKVDFTRYTNGVADDINSGKITVADADKIVKEKYKDNDKLKEKAVDIISKAVSDKEIRDGLKDADTWYMEMYNEKDIRAKAYVYYQNALRNKRETEDKKFYDYMDLALFGKDEDYIKEFYDLAIEYKDIEEQSKKKPVK